MITLRDAAAARARRRTSRCWPTHFLRKYAAENGKTLEGFTDEALERLCGYAWPGNVRELENVVERAVVLCNGARITAAELPAHLLPAARAGRHPRSPARRLDEIERYAITKTLEATGGSTSKAAEMLGISVRKIQYKLHEYQSAPKSKVDAVKTDPES